MRDGAEILIDTPVIVRRGDTLIDAGGETVCVLNRTPAGALRCVRKSGVHTYIERRDIDGVRWRVME
jgi:hypothetical protein